MAEPIRIQDIIQKIQASKPDANVDLIQKAYVFAAQAHEGQTRKSGEPYLMHPVAVGGLVADLHLDEHAICAAILHDTVEDSDATVEDIEELFGPVVARLVDGLTKLSKIKFHSNEERQAENFRKMIVAMSRDLRVILVKLADRLHNMRTLDVMPEAKQKRIAQETLDIYAPLANRLGINAIKQELEDLSFRYLFPSEYKSLSEKIAQTRKAREEYTSSVIDKIHDLIKQYDLDASISGRPKHLFSIWSKMRRQRIDFEHVYDLLGFRICTDSEKDCYQALGLVHMHWRPIPGRFKDYIALPKANRYRSLHTAVIGPDGHRIEIQIRTREMHEVAEHGVAAHWAYKEGKSGKGQETNWIKQLVEWQRELKDPEDFLDTIKLDLFVDDIYSFTPNGDLRVLPRGSTPIDFAYAIHSEVGDTCAGALVNGRMVPLDTQLRNGDMIEVKTKKDQKPNPDWLRFVRTGRAKNCIRAYQKKTQRVIALELGRELLDKELKLYGKSVAKVMKKKELLEAAKQMGLHSDEELLVQVGTQKLRPSKVTSYLLSPDEQERGPIHADQTGMEADDSSRGLVNRITESFRRKVRRQRTGIRVDGLSDILVRTAKCCQPVPGDRIMGYVTQTQGVSIHHNMCVNIVTSDPSRKVNAYWENDSGGLFPTWIRVVCENTQGKLADMSNVFSSRQINILNANCHASVGEVATNDFEVVVQNSSQLEGAMSAMRNLPGVVSVERFKPN